MACDTYFIAGGGCYGSYYVRQLDRARKRGLLDVRQIVVVDRDPHCAVADSLRSILGARLEVSDWLDWGKYLFEREAELVDQMWVPTPIGPHILFHWVTRRLEERLKITPTPTRYPGRVPSLPFAQVLASGTLVLSHAPGVCPVNCVEPKLCPLTKSDRDWEMKDTVRSLVQAESTLEDVGVFICQHYAHGVGTIPLRQIFEETRRLEERCRKSGVKDLAVATVSSCHGIVDTFRLP